MKFTLAVVVSFLVYSTINFAICQAVVISSNFQPTQANAEDDVAACMQQAGVTTLATVVDRNEAVALNDKALCYQGCLLKDTGLLGAGGEFGEDISAKWAADNGLDVTVGDDYYNRCQPQASPVTCADIKKFRDCISAMNLEA